MQPTPAAYKAIAEQKKLEQARKIPREWKIAPEAQQNASSILDMPATCGIMSPLELEITSNHDATALVEGLKEGTWSVEQVTVAFCKRAAVAHQLVSLNIGPLFLIPGWLSCSLNEILNGEQVNCLTEIFFDEAIDRARQLDKQRAESPDGKSLPPLFGLPISLKDSFNVQGLDASTGLACYVNEPAGEHSSLVAMLLDLGAVLYCKTNVPQSIMTGDSENNVFGRTLNPRNVAMTAGGSTGGEGALIALRGSILGVGTDIAGSIRIPALCNGLYGVRPTTGTVPHDGARNLDVPGTDGVKSTAGPIATTLRDCTLFLKSLMQAETWRYDSAVVSLPWRDLGIEPGRKLRIGLVENDGVYTPSPPMRRALKKAADLLQKSDAVEIVPLALPNVQSHYGDVFSYFTLMGSDVSQQELFVLRVDSQLTWTKRQHYLEQFGRTGEPLIPSLEAIGLLSFKGTDLKGYFDLNVRRKEAARTYLRLFLDNKIDAIMMPPAAHTAVPLDTWTTATYTGLWNYLDYPALTIPVDEVTDLDRADDPSNATNGDQDRKVYSLCTFTSNTPSSRVRSIKLTNVPFAKQILDHSITKVFRQRSNWSAIGMQMRR